MSAPSDDANADAVALDPPTAAGGPRPRAAIKREPAHFQVTEIPAQAPGGDGPHLWLEIERAGMNTEYAARVLARTAGVAVRDVGYAGLKDRHALTRQWFSVPAGDGRPALAGQLEGAGLRVLDSARSARKLRRGALAGNRFRIVVAGAEAAAAPIPAACERLRAHGVPNYFGAQRFGHSGRNLERAREMFAGTARVRDRHLRGLYLSAARAALFNRVLAARVAAGSWRVLLPGEAVALDGSASYFVAEDIDDALARRLQTFDVHASGPLWGRGASPARAEAAAVEAAALAGGEDLMDGLAAAGLEHARRALRVAVPDLALAPHAHEPGWRLEFTLPPGAYATVVLRELFDVFDEAGR